MTRSSPHPSPEIRTPRVLNKHAHGIPAGAVFCGRGSHWGNPYRIGPDGSRDDVCDNSEKHVLPHLDVTPLQGKDLVCFCAPKRCHCDALLHAANANSANSTAGPTEG